MKKRLNYYNLGHMERSSSQGKQPGKRFRKRHARRFSPWVGGFVGLVLVVLLTPMLIPERALRQWVANDLSAQTGLAVEVGGAELGWLTGVQLSNLLLKNPETQAVIRATSVKLPFEPMSFLAQNQISFMRMDGVGVEVPVTEEIPDLSEWACSEPIRLPIHRVQFSNICVSLTWPDGYQNRIQIPWLEFINDESAQTIKYASQARFECVTDCDAEPMDVGRLSTNGEFNLVRQEGQQCLAGLIHSQWQDLDLSSWRLTKVKELNLAELEGKSGGRLTFKIFPDFRFSWELETAFDQFSARQKHSAKASMFNRVTLQTNGSYDPVTGNLSMDRLDITSPALAMQGRISGQFEERGLVLNLLDSEGQFDSSFLPSLVPSLAEFLDEDGQIGGPCRFDFEWLRKPVGYVITASIDADAVRLSRTGVADKRLEDPFHWSMAVHVDKQDWPWMVVDRFDFNLGSLIGSGHGRLPMIDSDDELSWWLAEAKRAGTVQLDVEIQAVEKLGRQIQSVDHILQTIGLAGPMSFRLGYEGHDDVGRVDLDANLGANATLHWNDQFVKPVGEKLAVNLQGFWPWESSQPEMWMYLFGKCGQTEVQTKDRPMKLIWAFSENPDGQPRVDILNDTVLEISGLDQLLPYMPQLRQEIHSLDLAGKTTIQLGAAVQASQATTGWKPNNARVFLDINADQARILLPDHFEKSKNIPLRLRGDYGYNEAEERQSLSSEIVWQGTRSQFNVVRTGGTSSAVRGRYEFAIDELNGILASLPGLKRYLPDGFEVNGGMNGAWHWLTDQSGSRIDWNFEATKAAVRVDGKVVKPRGELASFRGEITLPAEIEDAPPTYTISTLRTQVGKSFVNLKHGSFRPPSILDNKWLEMWGVEPWLVWREGPVEAFDMEVIGRLEMTSSLWNLDPTWLALKDQYALNGCVDFDVKSELENNQLKTILSSRLDELGIEHNEVFAKKIGLPGQLNLTVNLWPDSRENKVYYCQVNPLQLNLGPLKCSGQGYGEFYWSDVRNLLMENGLAKIKLEIDSLTGLEGLSPKLVGIQSGGLFSADLTLQHQNGNSRFGPCDICLDDIRADLSNQPVMVDGRIFFSNESTCCDELVCSAGISSFRSNWYTLLKDEGVTGVANIQSDHLDVDQIHAFLEPLTNKSITSMPAYQDETLAKFQPWRKMAINSDFLLNLNALWFQATDPRSDLRYQLKDVRCQLDLDQDHQKGRPTGNLRFWNRVADGLTYGIFTAWLDEENPTMNIASSVDNIKMSEKFKPLVEDFFPGLNVENRYTTHEKITQKMFTTRETAPNYPVGYGNMIFTDGYMIGRAGPSWIVRLFPGLNFTRYNFERMHNWYSKKEDGVTHNNMIFVGKPWNLYIEGDSNPDKTILYEIGVDVLARYESEYWSSIGQGRVPIFVTSGKIVNGKMENHRVKYVPPHEVIYRILVKNNAITGAYRFLMKDRP